jgi:hypothetical protein
MNDQIKDATERMKATGEAMAGQGNQLGVKMLDQAEQNTREAFAAMRAAAASKDVNEVMRVQGDYLREQSNRSMAQAREIGEMIVNFGRDAVGGLTKKD